jgi:hypothetical protein
MANISDAKSSALWRQMQQELRFPPLLTLFTGIFAVLAWNAFVYRSSDTTAQLFRAAVPFWAAFTACFFIVSRQPRVGLKTVGWTGLIFSVFALVMTVAEVSGR